MRIFVSYHSAYRNAVLAMVEALRAARPGFEVFVDQQALQVGGFWLPQLHEEIAKADGFVFVFGERMGPWQAPEYYGAFDRRVKEPALPIVPVLLDKANAPGLPFFNQLHWLQAAPAGAETTARIVDALERPASAPAQELWRIVNPYRGLQALREEDAALLYGREELLKHILGHFGGGTKKVTIAVGNSGVGKSSLIYAGVFAALARQHWPTPAEGASWPSSLNESRSWSRLHFKPGEQPLRELARAFVGQWRDPKSVDYAEDADKWARRLGEADDPLEELIHASNRWAEEQGVISPKRTVLYIDQAEELYTRADRNAAQRLSAILKRAAGSQRLSVIMSLRADFYGKLQDDSALFAASEKVDVPRLDEEGFRAVVTGPAKLMGASFEDGLADELVKAAARQPVGLPLVSYQLTELWREMVAKGDGVLRWPRRRETGFDLARALVDKADRYLAANAGREEAVRRLFCVKLVHVPEQGAPTRRIALQRELSAAEIAIAQDLSGPDFRLLAAGETDTGEASVEVGHEALLTAWERLKNWIVDRRDFYVWLTRLESDRRAWEAAGKPDDALLMGRALDIARGHRAAFGADVRESEAAFIAASEDAHAARVEAERHRERKRIENETKQRLLQRATAISGVVAVIVMVWIAVAYGETLGSWWTMYSKYRAYAKSESALAPLASGRTFQDCASDSSDCPEMVVLPQGEFKMGSADGECCEGERPLRRISVARFAVSKYEITFDQWAACVAGGGCRAILEADESWNRRDRPVIMVTWKDAKEYVKWLSSMTGAEYRLLSEAEWEYAARGVTRAEAPRTRWGFGDDEAELKKYAWYTENSERHTHPVGEKRANRFGLYDMHGNVFEWVEDCYGEYDSAKLDSKPMTSGDCQIRVLRGGSWGVISILLRSAYRGANNPSNRNFDSGFRVARTLSGP